MVTIDEIDSRKKLEAWLKALPQGSKAEEAEARRIAVSVAARAAARLLPIWWRFALENPEARENNLTALPVLKTYFLLTIASTCPNEFIIVVTEDDNAARLALFADAFAAATTRAAFNSAAGAANNFAYSADPRKAALVYDTAARASAKSVFDAARAVRHAYEDCWHSVRADLRRLAAGQDVFATPLWHGDNPLSEPWRNVQASVAAGEAAADWAFWVWWYEGVLTGTAPDPASSLMVEIATSKEIDWEDVPKALTAINAIWGRHKVSDENREALLVAHQLMEAALADFRLDQARRLMRMAPFAKDLKVLDDPELLALFLDDAEELRGDIDGLAEALRREGRAMQGAGLVGYELEKLSEEFSKARQLQSLNVGAVVKFGEFLHEASLHEETRREFGLGAKKLDQIVEGVSALVRAYFGQALLRFAPLEELELEAGTSAWEYLNELRCALRDMKPEGAGALRPLAAEDVKVLEVLADEVERVLRVQDGATGEAKSSFQREVNYRLALLTVSISLYAVRAKEAEGTLRPHVDGLLGQVKRAKGLWALWEAFKALF